MKLWGGGLKEVILRTDGETRKKTGKQTKKKEEFGGGDLLDESQEAAPLWGFHLLCV